MAAALELAGGHQGLEELGGHLGRRQGLDGAAPANQLPPGIPPELSPPIPTAPP